MDTNVLVGMIGRRSPWRTLADAIVSGQLTLAVTTSILLEYDEVSERLYGEKFKEELQRFLGFAAIAGQVMEISPTYRFHTITEDAADDAFADCAIIADAEYIITKDRHFHGLTGSGYRPQPISPEEFITRLPPPPMP